MILSLIESSLYYIRKPGVLGRDFAAFLSRRTSMKCFDLYFSRGALAVELVEYQYTKTI